VFLCFSVVQLAKANPTGLGGVAADCAQHYFRSSGARGITVENALGDIASIMQLPIAGKALEAAKAMLRLQWGDRGRCRVRMQSHATNSVVAGPPSGVVNFLTHVAECVGTDPETRALHKTCKALLLGKTKRSLEVTSIQTACAVLGSVMKDHLRYKRFRVKQKLPSVAASLV
jgi:hypothetical protein